MRGNVVRRDEEPGGPGRDEPRLRVGFNHYFDTVTAAAGYAEVYGVVTLRIASF